MRGTRTSRRRRIATCLVSSCIHLLQDIVGFAQQTIPRFAVQEGVFEAMECVVRGKEPLIMHLATKLIITADVPHDLE